MNQADPWAVLWDVDGTLVDTAELHFQAWLKLANELGKPFTRADFAGTFGWRNPEIIPKLFGTHYSEAEIADLGDYKENLYRAEAEKGVSLLPGVVALLHAIAAAGGKQAIGSSAPRRNIELILTMTNTGAHFAAVVALEDTRRGKPDPEVFLRGAEALDIDPNRCIVLEDAPVGVQAAKTGGMKAVGITFVGHHSAEKLRGAGADLVVNSLEHMTVRQLIDVISDEPRTM
ncbi:MAG: HAD family phosphatase [Planctomycetes bacterium]|nr:HAD family phosphatase [Planctomycetota bacterium]